MAQKLTGQFGIMLRVRDLEQASSWYCSHFGFTLGAHDFHDFAELHVNGRNVLHLLKSDGSAPMREPNFALYVNDAESLHQSLKASGVEVTDRIRRADHAEFFVIDSDGNKIGLIQWF